MAGSTLTTFYALMKERYMDSSIVERLVYPDNPLLAKLQKIGDTEMVGDTMPVPIFTALPQGLSAGFTTAQTNAGLTSGNTTSNKWAITAGDYFGVIYIGDKVIMASRTNKGAFLANKEVEMDGLLEQAGENMSVYLWGNGGQAIGRRLSINGNDVTLSSDIDAQNFEVGMNLKASPNDGSTSTDSQRGGTAATLTAVNRSTGVITATTYGNITSFADGDYLFREGDFFGDQGTIVIRGVQSFITATDTPPALWGVSAATRATDPQRYAGCRLPTSVVAGKTYEERIKILLSWMAGRFKVKTSGLVGYMNGEDFQVLESLMATKGIRPLEDDSTKFGFSRIDIQTAAGRIPIICDRHCPKGTFFVLRMDDWGISSMGELLHWQNGDGMQILRVYNSTNYEARVISYPLLYNRAPKNSGRVPLT